MSSPGASGTKRDRGWRAKWGRMLAQETFGFLVIARDRHRRKRSEKHPSVPAVRDARVTNCNGTKILFAADETSDALLQGESRFRELKVAEGASSLSLDVLDARFHQR